jgi:hypothetical protein
VKSETPFWVVFLVASTVPDSYLALNKYSLNTQIKYDWVMGDTIPWGIVQILNDDFYSIAIKSLINNDDEKSWEVAQW